MPHANSAVANLLQVLELGASVAEADTLLEAARIETSAFADLLNDRVDLVPGTKGSGKSALFRIQALLAAYAPCGVILDRAVLSG